MQETPTGYVWYVLGLLCVVNVFNYMDRVALSVLLPAIKADLNLSDSELGLLAGFAFAILYAFCALPIAWLADRSSRANIIAAAIAVWSVMTALCGAAQNFFQLFAARIGVGAGEAGSLPASQSLICDYVPVKRRSSAFGINVFGNFAGMMIGFALAGLLVDAIGWRLTFVALGLPGLVLAMVVWMSLREPVRGIHDGVGQVELSPPLARVLAFLMRCRTYVWLTTFAILNGFALYGLMQWWPSFYVRSFELSASSIGPPLGFAIGGGSALGLIVGGFIGDRVSARDVRLPIVAGAILTLCAIPLAVATLFAPSSSLSIAFVGLTMLVWSASYGPVTATLYSVVPAGMRATSGAMYMFLVSLLGFGLGPFLVGVISETLSPRFGENSLRYALLAPVCFLPLMVFALLKATRTLSEDLRAATSGTAPSSINSAQPGLAS